MKKTPKYHAAASRKNTDISLELLIKITANEFGITEDEVRASAASFIQQNKSSYPAIQNSLITV